MRNGTGQARALRHTEVVRFTPLFIVLCATAGCSSAATSGGQTGEESAGCVVAEQRELGRDEASPIGVVPSDVFALVDGPFVARLWWSDRGLMADDGTSTGAHLAFTPADRPASYVEEDDVSGRESAFCSAYVRFGGELRFRTEDGSFDEAWDVTLRAKHTGVAEAIVDIGWNKLSGSYDFDRLVPEGHTGGLGYGRFSFEATERGPIAEGTIAGVAERRQGSAVGARTLWVGTIRKDSGAMNP